MDLATILKFVCLFARATLPYILTISFNWTKLKITISTHRVNLFAFLFMPEENRPT